MRLVPRAVRVAPVTGRRYEIDDERSARCSVADVVSVLHDSSSWPQWQPEIISVEGSPRLETGDVVRGSARMLGFGVHGHSTITEAGDGGFSEDVLVGVRMKVTYEVRADGDGAVVVQRLRADLPGGISGRLLSLLLRPRLRRMQREALRQLVRRAESS
jgi:hypothetical protein